jgi:hypothetical protein
MHKLIMKGIIRYGKKVIKWQSGREGHFTSSRQASGIIIPHCSYKLVHPHNVYHAGINPRGEFKVT